MTFTLLDWSAILGYLLITLSLGLYFRRKAGRSTAEYFVSGRKASWWLAGTSMVATTFAADTPLLVAGLVYTQGVSGNWIWWAFLPSGMMTVFLFARLWRRSGLMTDVQFAEMRYSGGPAAFLRGFLRVPYPDFRPGIFRHRRLRPDRLHFLPDSIHWNLRFARRPLRRPLDRSISVRVKDGHRYRHRLLRRESRGRHEHHDFEDQRHARHQRRLRPARVPSRFFARFR